VGKIERVEAATLLTQVAGNFTNRWLLFTFSAVDGVPISRSENTVRGIGPPCMADCCLKFSYFSSELLTIPWVNSSYFYATSK